MPSQLPQSEYSYQYQDFTILTDHELCSKKKNILVNLFEKYKNWEDVTTLSEYYIYALEVIKNIMQHIIHNDIYMKQNIRFYNRNEEYVTHIGHILGESTLYVFDSIDDDIEYDIEECQITEYVNEIENLTAQLLVHQDFHDLVLSSQEEVTYTT